MVNLVPVVLCGGSGTRLWPLSREQFPKQFISLLSEHSLFQETLKRLQGLPQVQAALIVCHEAHRFLVAEQLRQIRYTSQKLLLEPEGRNTAAALTLAALWSQAQSPEAQVLLVLPSDHVISDIQAFHEAIAAGCSKAQAGQMVAFGVTPERPETGYGYIQAEGSQIRAFIEKPDLATAEAYLRSGQYLWNAGIFMCRPEVWLHEIESFAPDVLQACTQAVQAGQSDQLFFRPAQASFLASPALSIDCAVMEKTELGAVVSLAAGWSDLGSWDALQGIRPQDAHGNICRGDVVTFESHNNLLESTGRLLTAVGVNNLVVVETPDAVMVASQAYAQQVRQLAAELKAQARPEVENHRKVARPWGCYETVDKGPNFQVKRITVHPGQALSKQMHHHRSEHWVVVRGTARVTRGEEVSILSENQSTYIPLGMVHRLENPGTIPLELIEIQSGSYLGEDDIVRYEDLYQRHESQD